MNTPSSSVSESAPDPQGMAPAAMSATRPMYWSVRRELWENSSIYIAPLAVAAVMLFGFTISAIAVPPGVRCWFAPDSAHPHGEFQMPYDMAAFLIFLTAFFVGIFYCLDALYGERRDRSILFWKSLPVSDLTTVLSKAAIPLVVLPLIAFAIIAITWLSVFLLTTLVLLGKGGNIVALWAGVPLFKLLLALLYALTASTLWYAPIYGWLLLVSGWARRATLSWATLPFFGVCVIEKIAFNTSHFAAFLKYRCRAWFAEAFVHHAHGSPPAPDPLTQLTPGKFLSSPGLWIGLAFAAVFLAAAVRLRRDRGPI
jgi:ABC-2 type transport system permease protein